MFLLPATSLLRLRTTLPMRLATTAMRLRSRCILLRVRCCLRTWRGLLARRRLATAPPELVR